MTPHNFGFTLDFPFSCEIWPFSCHFREIYSYFVEIYHHRFRFVIMVRWKKSVQICSAHRNKHIAPDLKVLIKFVLIKKLVWDIFLV